MSAERWHGTAGGYSNHHCRCRPCKDAWNERQRLARHRRKARLLADPTLAAHGLGSTYVNWGCRCQPCTDAYSVYRKSWVLS